jgi:hypothetical protein
MTVRVISSRKFSAIDGVDIRRQKGRRIASAQPSHFFKWKLDFWGNSQVATLKMNCLKLNSGDCTMGVPF